MHVATGAGGGPPITRILEAGFGYASLSKGDIETDIDGATLNPNVSDGLSIS